MFVWLHDPGIVQVTNIIKNGSSNNFSITHISSLPSYCVTGDIRSNPLHSLAIHTPTPNTTTLFTSDLLIKNITNINYCVKSGKYW
jgi:hypothetical protein